MFCTLTLRKTVFLGHRPDLSTLSTRELFRSRNNASGIGIGSDGPLGRLLVRGELGHDIIPELYPLEREPVIDKPGKGAFAHTDFDLLLRIRGIQNLVLAGVTTDVCISTTMREANDRGYDCLLVKDGSAAVEEVLHAATCEGVRMEGGIFGATASVEDVLETLREQMPVD
jgi:nicotinamidase-related amidase